MGSIHLLETYLAFVRNSNAVVYRVSKSMELVSCDSPAETDVDRRSSTTAKVFVSTLKGSTQYSLDNITFSYKPYGRWTWILVRSPIGDTHFLPKDQ